MMFLKNLSELLYVNKMSRSDLARALGIAPSTVNSWFNRSCENVSLKTLVEIASYFKITLDDLVSGDITTKTITTQLTQDEVKQLKILLAQHNNKGGGLNG